MEIVNILKFQRMFDCWVCAACDSENSVKFTHCAVCASIRTPNCIFVNKYGVVMSAPPAPHGVPAVKHGR